MSFVWVKTKSIFASLLQSFLHLMTPSITQTLFPQQPVHIDVYESSVLGTYVRGGEGREAAKNYSIKQISLYKCKSHPYHEYIIVQVAYKPSLNHKPMFLRLERTRSRPEVKSEEEFFKRLPDPLAAAYREALTGATPEDIDDNPVEEATYLPPATPSTASSQTGSFNLYSISESSLFLKNLNGHAAVDTVTSVSPDSFNDDEQLDSLPTKGLSLARLACLAKIVHDEDPFYSVFRHQCYWYANLIMKVIEKKSSRGEGKEDDDSKDTLHLMRSHPKRGTWWRIPVGKVERKLVETISARFEEAWAEQHQRLIAAAPNGNGGVVPFDSGLTRATNGGDKIEGEDPTRIAELEATIAAMERENLALRQQLQSSSQ